VGGVAVNANQEMILRATWMTEETRNAAFLATRAYTADELASMIQTPSPESPEVKLPAGEVTREYSADEIDSKVKPQLPNFPKVKLPAGTDKTPSKVFFSSWSHFFSYTSTLYLLIVIICFFTCRRLGLRNTSAKKCTGMPQNLGRKCLCVGHGVTIGLPAILMAHFFGLLLHSLEVAKVAFLFTTSVLRKSAAKDFSSAPSWHALR
jgi:hypothetical protein